MADVGGGVIGRPITQTEACEAAPPHTQQRLRISRRARTPAPPRAPSSSDSATEEQESSNRRESQVRRTRAVVMPKTRKQRQGAAVRDAVSPFQQPMRQVATTPRQVATTPRNAAAAPQAVAEERRGNRLRRADHSRAMDKFFGESVDELHDWLFQVDAIADADEWTDQEKYKTARVMLQGRARTEVLAFERRMASRGQRINWTSFWEFLKKKFGPNDPQVYYTDKLIACRQGLREDVDTFTTRFRTIVYDLLEADPAALSERMQVQHYKNGLRPELRTELLRSNTNDLDAAEEAARTGERIWRAGAQTAMEVYQVRRDAPREHKQTRQRRESESGPSTATLLAALQTQNELLTTVLKRQSEMQGMLDSHSKLLNQLKPAPKRCDYCQKRGHTADQCFKRKNDEERKSERAAKPQEDVRSIGSTKSKPDRYCDVTIGDLRPEQLLFDSGSDPSVVSRGFLAEIGATASDAGSQTYTVANGGSLQCDGIVHLSVKVGAFELTHPFIVSGDVAIPVIVGKDFMRAAKATMDFGDGSIVLRTPGIEQTVRLASVMSETDGMDTVSLTEAKGRICAITAMRRPDATLTLGNEVVRDVNPERTVKRRATPAVIQEETLQTPQTETPVEAEAKREATPAAVQEETLQTRQLETPEETGEATTTNAASAAKTPSIDFAINPDLTPAQSKALLRVLEKHVDAFATKAGDLGRLKGVSHFIDTGTHRPTSQPPRRLAPPLMIEARRQIDEMLERGIIRNSTSPWASPILLTDKKDATKRFCVDFRALNAITKKDRYPLPRIDDSFDILGGNYYFSSLDLQAGYWQVGVNPADIEKTAFTCLYGLFEFVVMPFGLCNAPATFQRAMDLVLAGEKWRTCLVYIDDILVFAPTFKQHLERLATVLRRMIDFVLKLKPSKCTFGHNSLAYLGHIITGDGIRVDPQKVQAVTKLAPPTNKPSLRSFLGLSSYYQRFVRDYARIAQPLSRLLRDGNDFVWDTTCGEAFNTLKNAVIGAGPRVSGLGHCFSAPDRCL